MTRLEHYREAERLLEEFTAPNEDNHGQYYFLNLLTQAQVHATLASSGIE